MRENSHDEPGGGPRASAEAQTGDSRYKWLVLITVVFGAFAAILDSTIVNTALPTIQHDFSSDLHTASFVATGYILASGVIVPLTAFLSNRFGIKRTYIVSLAVFTGGSALCGLAPSIGLLIAFRVLQGAGGAALFPLAFAILFEVFPDEERGRANGVFGIPVLVAPAIGPTIGGFLVQYFTWHWIFYVNLPIGIAGILLAMRYLRENAAEPHRRFDAIGFVFVAAGVALLLYGLSNLAYDGLNDLQNVAGPVVLGVILTAAFVWIELRRREPLLDLRLYRLRNFLVGNIITWVATIGLFVPAFLLPQYLQTLLGLSPFVAGLLLLPQGVGSVFGSFLSGQLYNRLGPRLLIFIGSAITLVSGYFLATWTSAAPVLGILIIILLPRGIGLPILTQPTNTSSLDGIRGRRLPGATTLNVVVRNVMASLAIAVLINVLQQRTQVYLSKLGNSALAAAARTATGHAASEPFAVRQGQALAYHDVFLITALSIVPVFVLGWLMRSPVPWRRRKPGAGAANAEAATTPAIPPATQDGRGVRTGPTGQVWRPASPSLSAEPHPDGQRPAPQDQPGKHSETSPPAPAREP